VPNEYLETCSAKAAEPLVSADQTDLARALVDVARWGRNCKAKLDALIEAVKVREALANQLEQQK
jgi:hypothetical protein